MAKQVALHDRDLAILELLLERRAETLDELHERFFTDAARQTARNRLARLQQGGYLKRESVPLYGSEGSLKSVYTLGPRARTALIKRSPKASESFRGREFNPTLRATSFDHQILTNRIGDWLGTNLHHEHLLPAGGRGDAFRHRPDAVYPSTDADHQGRSLVFLEVDLGHYSRDRVLGKVNAFLTNPHARGIVFASPNRERTRLLTHWIRDAYGDDVLTRVQALTFEELHDGGYLREAFRPAPPQDQLDAA